MAMVEGEYEYFYYRGDCEVIRHQIADMFRRRLERYSWQLCGAASCSVEEIEVNCGFEARRKRSADDLSENVTQNTATNSTYLLSNSDLETQNTSSNLVLDLDDIQVRNLTSNTSQETLIKKYLKIKFKVNITTDGNTAWTQRNIPIAFRRMRIRLQNHLQAENMTINTTSGGVSVPVVVVMETRIQNDLELIFERCPSGYILKIRSFWNLKKCGKSFFNLTLPFLPFEERGVINLLFSSSVKTIRCAY